VNFSLTSESEAPEDDEATQEADDVSLPSTTSAQCHNSRYNFRAVLSPYRSIGVNDAVNQPFHASATHQGNHVSCSHHGGNHLNPVHEVLILPLLLLLLVHKTILVHKATLALLLLTATLL
jgi:hypothetical protein